MCGSEQSQDYLKERVWNDDVLLCRKNGLSCVSECGECNGFGSNNEDNTALKIDEDSQTINEGNTFFSLLLF